MKQYINKAALVAEIMSRIDSIEVSQKAGLIKKRDANKKILLFKSVLSLIDTIEMKEVNEVPATVMVNKYGNRYISSWAGLKEYDDLKEGQEIKIVIPKK